LKTSEPVYGLGGRDGTPTLASFSLAGKVGVVTGGARGLGLVMGQGIVTSGADLALVDIHSKSN
jgi:D-arabinitol 2-dehydrogenase